jgi:hypothetical protein
MVCSLSVLATTLCISEASEKSVPRRAAVLHTTPCIGINAIDANTWHRHRLAESEAVAQQDGGCLLLHYCVFMNERGVAGGGGAMLCTSLC